MKRNILSGTLLIHKTYSSEAVTRVIIKLDRPDRVGRMDVDTRLVVIKNGGKTQQKDGRKDAAAHVELIQRLQLSRSATTTDYQRHSHDGIRYHRTGLSSDASPPGFTNCP